MPEVWEEVQLQEVVVGIDVGGTAVKAAVHTTDGRELGLAGEAIPPTRAASGHLEREPRGFWEAVCRVIRVAIAQAAVRPDQIAAVGLTGYGNGLWLVDETGQPVGNGILSSDIRAADIVRRWQADGIEPGHRHLTDQGLWPGKPAPLLAWLQAHRPDSLARARHLLFCKDFVRLRLTGLAQVEPTDLSAGSLIEHATGRCAPVFDHLGLSKLSRLVPPITEPLSVAGCVTPDAATATGLSAGTPVCAGLSDCAALMLGAGVTSPDQLLVVSGTWGLNQRQVATPIADGSILANVLGARIDTFIAVAGGPTSASTLEWFVQAFMTREGMVTKDANRAALYALCNELVAGLGSDEPPVYFLPFLNGLSDQGAARGAFIGLSSWHGLAHAVRAVFEGVAFEHRRNVEALLGGTTPSLARFAGGAARSPPWRRIFAATLGTRLELPQSEEVGALGAAIAASVSVGLHASVDQATAQMCRLREAVEPDPDLAAILARRYRGYLTLCQALQEVWPQLD